MSIYLFIFTESEIATIPGNMIVNVMVCNKTKGIAFRDSLIIFNTLQKASETLCKISYF
jgi:hypothetical protein